jgi:hypothetical protein
MYIYPDYFGHNASDAQNFIDMLPNVTANYIYWDTGGRTNNNFKRIVDISLNDPLVKWYANHTSIVWLGTSGRLNIDGEPFFLNYTQNAVPVGALMTPAYYFTHGKVGNCAQIATVAYVVMKLKGFQCVEVYGTLNGEDHDWVEAKIAGTIYVINFDGVTPAKELYSSHPEWVPEKRFTEENPYVDCGPME